MLIKQLDPDTNSGRMTGRMCFKKRFFGGYQILAERKSEHLSRKYWEPIKPEEIGYLTE